MACDVLPVATFVLHLKSASGLLDFFVLFQVVVYKPPPRKERKKKDETNGKKPVNV